MLITKWTSITAAVFGLAVCASTQAAVKNGLYLGAGVGGSYDRFDFTARNIRNGMRVSPPVNTETHAVGNAFLGFGGTSNVGLFLAGEVGTYFPSRSTTFNDRRGVAVSNLTFSDTLKVQDYVTLDLLPGFRVSDDWLVYLRGGLTYANLSLRQPTVGTVPGFNSDENKLGARAGLGFNVSLTDSFGLGIDYIYTYYQSYKPVYTSFNTGFEQKTTSNYLGLSAIYSFD